MLRGGTLISAAVVTAAVALPATAQAASTYTVDGGAAAGCNADKVCKTLTDAVAKVAAGDAITVKEGTYTEPGAITLTKTGVTITGTPGKTTINTGKVTAGDPAVTLIQGDVLKGITIVPAADTGPGILITGRDAKVSQSAVARLNAAGDFPAIQVSSLVGAGTTTLDAITVLNGPAGKTGQTQPAVLGNATSSIAMNDSVILSFGGQGPALGLVGNFLNGATTVPNTVTRSSLIATNTASDALSFTSASNSSSKKVLAVDTAVIVGGSAASGVKVASLSNGAIGDSAGDLSASVVHTTIAGGGQPFFAQAAARGLTAAVGNVALSFDRSILHGTKTVTGANLVSSFTPVAGLLGAANTAAVKITTSDTQAPDYSANSGKATITRTGVSDTPDAALFANPAKFNYSLLSSAPVIDKGGAYVAGESATDIAQADRTKVTTDLGAYEFVNHQPFAFATASSALPKQGETVTFDASKAFDVDPGDKLVSYAWTFGDGSSTTTTTPTTTHAYAVLGQFNPQLTVTDTRGQVSAPYTIKPTIVVGDGSAPTLALSKPSKNGAYAITVNAKVGKKIKRVFDPSLLKKVIFAGKASDPSGIKFVQISIQRLAIGKAKVPTNPKACVYLGTNKTTFRSGSCKKPTFFTVPQKNGEFSYHLNSKVRPKPGKYQLAVLAIDNANVISNAFTIPFTLK